MSLPKYSDLIKLETLADIDQEIFLLQKNLFDFMLNARFLIYLFN